MDALERELVQHILLVRPAVEAGEKLGFLPGDLAQKKLIRIYALCTMLCMKCWVLSTSRACLKNK